MNLKIVTLTQPISKIMSCKDLHRQIWKSWSTDNSVSEKHFHPVEGKHISQLASQEKWVTKETATYHLTAPIYCYAKHNQATIILVHILKVSNSYWLLDPAILE